jgi:hypothetical protein
VDEDRVDTGIDVRVGPFACVLDAMTGDQALDPGDEDEVFGLLSSLGGRKPAGLLVDRNELALRLGAEEAVALGEEVVLDADRGDPRPLVFDQGPDDIAEPAVAVVAVGDHRKLGRRVDPNRGGEGLCHRDVVEIRHGMGHRRDAEAADPDRVEVVSADQLRGEGVVGSDGDEGAGPVKAPFQLLALGIRSIHGRRDRCRRHVPPP